jgi:hypothetical protein
MFLLFLAKQKFLLSMDVKSRLVLLKDIRFWIVFFFLIRMYGITFPPLEVGHNWRQTDGLMVARNFYERSANIFYPAVDVAGEKTGIVGCEFPILNYLIYLLSLVFGYQHWYGRIIVLIFSSLGVLFFYKLIKKKFNESTAFNASILLMVSLWFSYSRKMIPDVFAASLCVMSLYYAFEYFETNKLKHLLLFFILALVGCLSKILAATLLTVLIIPVLNPTIIITRKIMISFFSLIILSAVCYWYFVWVPFLNSSFGFQEHFFMGTSFQEGAAAIMNNWPGVLKRFYETPLKYTGSLAFLIALFFVIKKKLWIELIVFLLPFVSFCILLVKTGASVIGDKYYVLTIVPPLAFIIGLGLAQIDKKRIVTFILIIVAVEGIADQIYDFRIRQPYRSLENLEAIMDEVSQRNDLIVINANAHNPTAMYSAHRRGWTAPNETLSSPGYLIDIKNKGCKFIVIAKGLYGDLDLNYPKIHESEYFKIYRLP